MSLQANKKSIFVFLAGAIAVGGLMFSAFGGRQFFIKQQTFILYFDGSVNGLEPGCWVKFRGVPIGTVNSVYLHYLQLPRDRRIAVFVRLDVTRLNRELGLYIDLSDPAAFATEVRRGLRGKIEFDSYVSGKMYVDIGYYPDAPAPPTPAFETPYPVLPTLSSNASQIMSKIESALAALQTIDFQKVTDHFSDLLDNGSKRVAAIPFGAYNDKIISALNSVANFDAPYWDNRVHVFLASLIRYDHLSDTWDGQLFRNSGNLIGLGQNTRARIATFGRALLNLREQLQNGGEFRTGLDNSLKTVNALATSLNNRATALAQNPRVVTP